ncbi:MAG: hypothetical protein IPH89_11515 [Bacteroidetes bacterium]|nr:hypothetical protein [Bacteroidota bacterium]
MEQTQQTPQGKGMGVAGFVISLVALVFYLIIAGIVTAAAFRWRIWISYFLVIT